MGVWRSRECLGRVLKAENPFLQYLGTLGFYKWVSLFFVSLEIAMAGIWGYLC